MSVSHFALALFRRYPSLFTRNVLLAMLVMCVDAATLASVAPVVGLLTQGAAGTGTLAPYITSGIQFLGLEEGVETYLSVFVTLTITSSLLLIAINYYLLRAQYIVRNDMILGTAERVLYSGISFINAQRQGEFMNTLTLEVARVADAFTALTRLIAPVAQTIVLLWIPLFISWQVTVIAIAAAAVFLTPLKVFRRRVYGYGQENTQANNAFSSALQETLQNARLIIGFANMEPALSRLRNTFGRLRKVAIRLQFVQTTIFSLHQPIGILVVFVTFLAGRKLGVSLADIAVILYAFNRMAGMVAMINQNRSNLISLYPSYEQVIKIRDGAEHARVQFGTRSVDGLGSGIDLKDLSFAYDDGAAVLKGINLTIPAGKMTALVGESGAGKSTLADIVMGMQSPSFGEVSANGVPLRDMDIVAYRQQLGYVPQRTSLFHASVRDNIAWANPNATDADIEEACRMANADEFIRDLEDGYDTIVGDQGLRLSGGQMQRVSLARALVRKPALLVLDEATSALDTNSEQLIQSAIESIVGKTTILVIAHRLSTIKSADNIVVMEKGRIIDQGNFEQLIARDGTFAKLVDQQQL